MPEYNGYKTFDLVMQELKVGDYKLRQAIAALNIQPTTFNFDKRGKYYSLEDVQRIKEWLEGH
jgi:hypothetical protein